MEQSKYLVWFLVLKNEASPSERYPSAVKGEDLGLPRKNGQEQRFTQSQLCRKTKQDGVVTIVFSCCGSARESDILIMHFVVIFDIIPSYSFEPEDVADQESFARAPCSAVSSCRSGRKTFATWDNILFVSSWSEKVRLGCQAPQPSFPLMMPLASWLVYIGV